MRLISLAVIASLATAPGCALLAIPPAIGAAGGAAVAGAENQGGHHASVAGHAVAGAVVGLVVDALMVAVAAAYIEAAFEGAPSCTVCSPR